MKKLVSMKLDREMWQKFKIYCIKNGKTMSTEVEALIRKEIKLGGKNGKYKESRV